MGYILDYLKCDSVFEIIAQSIGVLALIVDVISYQMKSRNTIVTLQIFSCLLFSVHFFMLKAFTGAVFNVIACFRAFVFANKDKKWGQNKLWVPFFCVVCIAAVGFTWTGFICLLPMIGMIFTTFSTSVSSAKKVRFLAFPSSPLWIVYNFINRSYAGIVTETIVMISIISAIIRLDILGGKHHKIKNGAGGGN